MRKKIVAGNWKMHGSKASIQTLIEDVSHGLPETEEKNLEVIIFPPAIYLPLLSTYKGRFSLGAQNVYPKDAGAFTGEISAPMLKDYACRYVLVGHSERRHLFGESKKFIAEKFHYLKEHGMIPLLCVGETQEERSQGKTNAVLAEQIEAIFAIGANFDHSIVAYEPVWAIGSSSPATAEQAQEAHAHIRSLLGAQGKDQPILYGGSVTRYNAKALFAMPDVDGGLIGGASLDASQFVDIVKCIS